MGRERKDRFARVQRVKVPMREPASAAIPRRPDAPRRRRRMPSRTSCILRRASLPMTRCQTSRGRSSALRSDGNRCFALARREHCPCRRSEARVPTRSAVLCEASPRALEARPACASPGGRRKNEAAHPDPAVPGSIGSAPQSRPPSRSCRG